MENQIPDYFAESQNERSAMIISSKNTMFYLMTGMVGDVNQQRLDVMYRNGCFEDVVITNPSILEYQQGRPYTIFFD